MDWLLLLTVVGVTLQVVGVLIAIVGLNATWSTFREPGERLTDPVVNPFRVMAIRIRRNVRRIVRKKPKVHRSSATMSSMVFVQDQVQAEKVYGSVNRDNPSEAIEVLSKRSQELLSNMNRLDRETLSVKHSLRQQSDTIVKMQEHVEKRFLESGRMVATSGLRAEFAGLLLVLIGIVIQNVASLWL